MLLSQSAPNGHGPRTFGAAPYIVTSHHYVPSDSSTVVNKTRAKASSATGADVATHVAWVDASRMTRDCLTHSGAEAQKTFVLIPLASMRDCITYTSCEFDLIVYHSHDDGGVNLSDAITGGLLSDPDPCSLGCEFARVG
jgi:hypothetical protein